jgi:hypothetical protein
VDVITSDAPCTVVPYRTIVAMESGTSCMVLRMGAS